MYENYRIVEKNANKNIRDGMLSWYLRSVPENDLHSMNNSSLKMTMHCIVSFLS